MTLAAPERATRGEDLQAALAELWALTRGDPRISVAVLDGHVDRSHESLLRANITELGAPGPPPAAEAVRHGTHVASVIFGQHDGPVLGVAPECRGLSVPLFSEIDATGAPVCSQRDLAAAVMTAVEAGADVINISAGEWTADGAVARELSDAVDECTARGVLVIAAAGVGGCARPQVPASLEPVLAVAADRPSAGGGKPSCLLAPGDEIPGAGSAGGVSRRSGSSYATAIVSGVAALLLSLRASPALVGEALRRSGPRLDVGEAVRLLLDLSDVDQLADLRFSVRPSALQEKFHGVSARDFGTVTVRLSGARSYRVPDFQYALERGEEGMWLVPVSDAETLQLPDGSSVPGSAALDAHLRREMGLGSADELFALLSYIHPEEHAYDAAALPWTSKLQLGHRHVGAYLGAGRTTQALLRPERWRGESPAQMEFNADLHPINVQVVSLEGAPQGVLNRNARIVDTLVIAGARVPRRADDLIDCRTVDLNTTLQYYRDVIRGSESLEELAWYTSCAVHKMIVVNLFLNLPHNEDAFNETFGPDGQRLWEDFKRRYEAVNGRAFTQGDETDFTPLWKQAGLSAESVRPLSLREYHVYHAARDEHRLDSFEGRRPLEDARGLAWPLETLVDLLGRFINSYFPFEIVGGVAVCAEVLLMADPLARRAGLDAGAYLEAVSPLIAKVLVAEALTRGTLASAWLAGARRELDWLTTHARSPKLSEAIERDVTTARMLLAGERNRAPLGRDAAGEWLRAALRPDFARLRDQVAPPGGRSGHFASPSIFHELAEGRHPCSPLVRFRTVCTVMDARDLVPAVAESDIEPTQRVMAYG